MSGPRRAAAVSAIVAVVVVMWVARLAAAAQGAGASALPRFDGSPITTVDVSDSASYRALGERIRDASAGSDRRYYVVVVGTSGEGSQATRNYADALFERWSRAGGFDPLRSVLIVVAVKNRQVAVRAGADLQARYGLRGATIQRDLVEPTFLPLARAGRLPDAVAALVEATERWVADRDRDAEGTRGESARRDAQVRRDADEALATANRLLQEARRELEEKRGAGLGVAGVEAVIERNEAALPPLQTRIEKQPREVLAEAQRAQHELEQSLGRLRGLPARQNEATARLQGLEDRIHKVEDALDAARQDGLPIGALQQALQVQLAARDEARAAVARDPEDALARVGGVESALEGLLARARDLPEARRRRERQAAEVARLAGELDGALRRAEGSGASVAAARSRYDQLRPRIEAATRGEVDDELAAIEALTALKPQLEGELRQVREAESKHRLLSRTLPLGAAAAVLSLIALLGGTFWFLTRQSRGRADRRVREFRRRATELMEQLDRLKERHRLLPVSDPDFTAPLEGVTLERYAGAQQAIQGLWSRWLEAMDRLETAQKILRKAPTFGVQKVQEAEKVVEDLKPLEEIAAEATTVAAELDLLGDAHEQARARKQRVDDALKAADQKIDALGAAGIKEAAYEAEGAAVAAALEAARGRLTPDPLTAAEQFGAAADRAESLLARVDAARERAERARRLQLDAETLRATVAAARAEGLRLDEPGADPDAALQRAERSRAQAMEALDAADPDAAATRLDESSKALAEGAALLERVRQAKRFVAAEAPARRRDLDGLREALEAARGVADELGRGHAAAAWREVAGAVPAAEAALEPLAGRIDEAESLGSDRVQRYLEARTRLEEIGREQQAARARLESVGRRRAELEAVRADVQAGLADFHDRLAELLTLADQRPREVGDEARGAVKELVEVERRLARDAKGPRPDWPALQEQLARAREGLAIARERAEADIQAHDRLAAEVSRLRPRLDQLGALLRREQKDRPPSNLRYRAAVEALARAEDEAARGSTDWPRLLVMVREAAEELERGEALAREDIRLATQAESELDGAERAIRTARGFSVLGVGADVRAAEAQLQQARSAMQGQDYEHAVQLATAAEQAARRALHAAEQEAARRQYGMENERRRRAAEAEARRSGRLPAPGGLPVDAWVIGAGQIADAIFRGAMAGPRRGGGFRIDMGGGPGPIGRGFPTPGGGGSGASQSNWGGGGGDSGTSQSSW
jgi:exonuclease SbcC